MDVKDVKKLIDAAKAADLTELIYENGETRVTIRRGEPVPVPAAVASTAAPAPAAAAVSSAPVAPVADAAPSPGDGTEAAASHLVEVTAPIVGTFYEASSPDASAFVKVGDHVQAGSVLCIIEAMKLMNEIEAETSGTIAEILVRNEEPVEYGQVLFRIDPD
jgi:acetyl-CoA carboxylase biotin carboxyl carrier protein